MDETPSQPGTAARAEAWFAVLLAWAAGVVDASGYLLLGHLFTAHMSGNSAALGAHLGRGAPLDALHRVLPVPVFVLGVGMGAAAAEGLCRTGVRSPLAAVLSVEACLLLATVFLAPRLVGGGAASSRVPTTGYLLALALPTLAMGMQNATLRRVGSLKVRTTYVSGMLTNLAEGVVAHLYWRHDRAAGRETGSPPLAGAGLYGGIWLAFAAGGCAGGFAAAAVGFAAFWLAVGSLAVGVAWDIAAPLVGSAAEPGCPSQAPAE